MNQNCKNIQTGKKHVGRKVVLYFNARGIYFVVMMTFMTILLQICNDNVQAKSLLRAKKTLKLLQSPPSLIQLRHKRQTQDEDDFYEDNYDVLPDFTDGSQPPTLGDQISEQAKQVAESFKKMWQSVTDSVRHCIDALRAMFGEPLGDEELTPEQEQQILADLEEKYRLQQQRDNEV